MGAEIWKSVRHWERNLPLLSDKKVKMKEVLCLVCKKGTGIFRHDKHVIHRIELVCYKCQMKIETNLTKHEVNSIIL